MNGPYLYLRSFNWAIMLVTQMDYMPTEGPASPFCYDALYCGSRGCANADFAGSHSRLGPARECRAELNDAEVNVITVVILACALLWTLVTAKFVDLIVLSDPDISEHANQMDDVDKFCRRHRLSLTLHRQCREYMQQTRHVQLTHARDRIQRMLSPELQIEVILSLNKHWFKRVPFFADAPPAFLVQVALAVTPQVCCTRAR